MDISVFGLGHIGIVSAACLAERGHKIIGVDVNPGKIELINAGNSPIIENGIDELLGMAHGQKRLRATANAEEAVENSRMAVICIGTPTSADGDVDTRSLENAARSIGGALKKKRELFTIVLRSTVPPGCSGEKIIPIVENASGKKEGEDFLYAFHPEFMREGSAVEDFNRPPKILVGTRHEEASRMIFSLYEDIEAEKFSTDIITAEMVKYMDNAFHATKVTFANEIGQLCKRLGVDTDAAMAVFRSDTKLNVSSAYLNPGFAFGGSCLPKDLRALTKLARSLDVPVPLLSSIIPSNSGQITGLVKKILALGKRRVGIAGISFKAGTNDIRESPLLETIKSLMGAGIGIRIYDSNVFRERPPHLNGEYLDQHLPDHELLRVDTPQALLKESEIIVIGNNNPEFRILLVEAGARHVILDLAGVGRGIATKANYEGICW